MLLIDALRSSLMFLLVLPPKNPQRQAEALSVVTRLVRSRQLEKGTRYEKGTLVATMLALIPPFSMLKYALLFPSLAIAI